MSTYPYTARLMACLSGHEPIELARFTRRMFPADVRAVTHDLDPAWEVYGEYPLTDRQTITPRVVLKHHSGSDRHAIHLTREQKKGAGIL